MQHHFTFRPGQEPVPGYKLVQLRGRGGYAEVWEASSPEGTVALKFMATRDSSAAAKEIRSIQAIKALRHPNLICIHQVWSQPGHIIIAMEIADGSLLEMLDAYQSEFQTPIEVKQLCLYLLQAAAGLDFLNIRTHAANGGKIAFQHCDIKPSNLLLVNDTVKLADFGLATVTTGPQTPAPRAGTLDFAAPEVFQGMITDRSDQFSLAVTYAYLRSGRFPYPEPPMSFVKNYTRPAPDLSPFTAPERAILSRALSPSPYDRWPSCVEFMIELARLFVPRFQQTASMNGPRSWPGV